MIPKKLPRELIPLIHHIELNKAGWWDRAIQQSIMFLIWLNDNRPMSLQEIVDNLQTEFKIKLDTHKVQQQIKSLGNRIIQTNNGFKLSESGFLKFQEQMGEVERIGETAKTSFLNLVNELCPSLDALKVWSDFNNEFLVPFVREMGAYVFHLVIEGTQLPKMDQFGKEYFTKFTSKYPDANVQLQEVVARFLNLKDPSVRQYILRTLNMYYYIEACGLTSETLKKLSHIVQSNPSFKVFIDTNFLFSILDLHDNPSNEAATALMELSKRLSPNVTVKFYVTSITIEEARRVLIGAKSSLEGIRTAQNLLQGLESSKISGILRRYFDACKENASLDVESFFRPYIDNLLSIGRKRGVELYNAKLEEYKTKQEVIDDIVEQQASESQQPYSRVKSYEALEHDMVLWHFVKDQRPAYVESPLEAEYWIVTIDYRLLGFDAHKRGESEQVPICIHPATLAQMLQFWVPRSDVLDEALLASLKLPLFFAEFDYEAEKISITILRALSRFENVEDLPVETVAKILLNESLRARMKTAPEEEEQIKLIKDALIDEQVRMGRELEEMKSRFKEKEKESEAKGTRIHKLEQELEDEKRRKEFIESQLQQAQQEIRKLQDTIQSERKRQEEEERRHKVRRFIVGWAILLIALLAIGSIGSVLVSRLVGWSIRLMAGTVDGILVIAWLFVVDYRAKKATVEHLFVKLIRKFKHWIWGLLSTGVIANALWDLIKGLLHR